MSRWSATNGSRRRVAPSGPPRRRLQRVLLGFGAFTALAVAAPAAVAVTEQAPVPASSVSAVSALPAATLPPADPTPPSISPVPLAPQGRDGSGAQVARSSTPLQLVAVTWTGPDPDTISLRSTDDSGAWGAWLPLDANSDERDAQDAQRTAATGSRSSAPAPGGTDPVWVGDKRAVEVRATRGGKAVTDGLAVQRIDPGTSGNDEAIGARARERQTAARDGAPVAPAYVTRAQWGADEGMMTWPPEYSPTTKAVTIHHTAESNDYSPEQAAAIVRGIYAYHAKKNGWGDIGYNALVDKYGTIYEGRAGGMDRPVIAAHAGGFNRETFGIAMMGNLSDVAPTPAELTSVEKLAAWKLGGMYRDSAAKVTLTSNGGGTSKFAKGSQATVDAVFAHRDVGNTACPGNAGFAAMDTIRAEVNKLVAAAGTDVRAAWADRPDLGDPDRVEQATADGRGRFTDFAHGSVYWSPDTGAHELSGPILDAWRARGADRSELGLPTGEEFTTAAGRAQAFERGVLRWDRTSGATSITPS
ncbi:N-acetylmuramoyl-L-alanine amidase [Actinomycetospora sp. NBRC 106378]|uniref:N-acetylmuramoyl-L-alanine amidase n=1 Tax=Actinomycetospora sp. NBRC 106378 TaxID=3032208 RepID=UPI0024A33ACE|nr:N-acetylmuramoyl-L-alanine amidase [Actinomycetospora sp. NBRC 106378]GLZ51237.1 N-acetylmuramoyl-L-alanine amidase [Actinomycetospora sp. NBRC 106378]